MPHNGGGQNATYHHNLLAHNYSRTPRFNGSKHHDKKVKYEYVNNVNYNWGKGNSAYGAYIEIEDGTYNCNMINNYYKPGPARPGYMPSFFAQSLHHSIQGDSLIAKWYMHGNIMEGKANKKLNKNNALGLDVTRYETVGISRSALIAKEKFEMPHTLKIESAKKAYKSVLKGAGAFPRDAVDERIVNEVRTGTASGKGTTEKYPDKKDNTFSKNPFYNKKKGIIDNPFLAFSKGGYPEYKTYNIPIDSDHDGMPDEWEIENGLDPNNPDDRNIIGEDGYTMLEKYLDSICN